MIAKRTVAIIGAGASGLAAAKILLEDGFDVTVFDRQKTVGGIWSPEWAYANLRHQTAAGFMEYSTLPDTQGENFAPWQQLHNYLQKYSDIFHITERIRFEHKVLLIDKDDLKDANLPWTIKIETSDGHHQTLKFDLVVVATGLFSTRYMPVFRDQNKFAGLIVHANDIKTYAQLEHKRIAVVGGGKSAIDLTTLAAKHAESCYMLVRRAHWLLAHNVLHGYLPLEYIFTRVFTVMFDPFPYAPHGVFYRFCHWIWPALFRKIFDLMSDDIIATYKADLFEKEEFIPKMSVRSAENFARITEEFIKLKRNGRLIRKLATIEKIIDATSVELDTGEFLQLDLIICATGFIEQFPFFSEIFNRILNQKTIPADPTSSDGTDLDLYRRVIPVGVPNIAFIGLPSSAVQWSLFEAQSHWTSDYFLGRLKLPATEEEMYEEIRISRNFISRLFNRKSYYLQYYWLEPIEIYLQDMGLQLHRTNNWISEYFGIYRPKRFEHLHEERQAKAEGRTHRSWYFSFGHTILLLLLLLVLLVRWFFS